MKKIIPMVILLALSAGCAGHQTTTPSASPALDKTSEGVDFEAVSSRDILQP